MVKVFKMLRQVRTSVVDVEDGLYNFLREELTKWKDKLASYQPLADTGSYPGKREIDAGLNTIARLLTIRDTFEFFEELNAKKNELLDLEEDVSNLSDFYINAPRGRNCSGQCAGLSTLTGRCLRLMQM